MNKRDFFLQACQAGAYRHKEWVLNAFSLTRGVAEGQPLPEKRYDFQLVREGKHLSYYPPNEVELVDIEDAIDGEPLYQFRDPLTLKAGDLPNLDKDVVSTYGNALFNFIVLVWPFGDKIDYAEGQVKLKAIEAEIEKRLTGDNETPRKGVSSPIYVSEYLNYIDAALSLVGYTQLCVPSATEKTMTRDPRIPQIRKELLEKYKDSLHDPATIAKIDAELIKVDREWMKGDPGERFYIKDKSHNVVRKKAHLMHGAESGFQDGPDVNVIKNSLSEGWDIEQLPAMVNSLREGSYSRGAMTALGGESAKTLTRIFQNARITEKDCGSKLGWNHVISEKNKGEFIGFHRIVPSGTEELTEVNIDKFLGKTVTLRTPMFCKTPKTGFCETCMGRQIAQNPNALGSLVSQVGSRFMDILMGKMHGSALKTAEYDPVASIR